MSIVNVDEYISRIRYNGSKEPNLENLRKLCEHQVLNIPFDTLDLFGGPGKFFDLHKIYQSIVKENRGGFCYELNALFGEFLKGLGYNVAFLEARVYKGTKQDIFSPPFDHMILKIELEGVIWIVDVGFGKPNFYLPKRLECLTEQTEITGTYRFREMPGCNNEFILETSVNKVNSENGKRKIECISKLCNGTLEWKIIYKFSIKEYNWENFKVGWINNTTNEKDFILNNSILKQIKLCNEAGTRTLWGYKFIERSFKDQIPNTIKVTEIPHGTPQELDLLKEFITEKFGMKISHTLDKLKSNFFKD